MIQLLERSVESGDRGTKVKGSGQECPLHTSLAGASERNIV
jgi:hypothetical protein